MDWRERRYYLVRLNDSTLGWWQRGHDDYGEKYKNYYNMLKRTVPSIKISEPYNHFLSNTKMSSYGYDGALKEIGYVQLMISCRKEYCEIFEKTVFEIQENDPKHVVIKEITKNMCGQ